jgi:hypothetical protein
VDPSDEKLARDWMLSEPDGYGTTAVASYGSRVAPLDFAANSVEFHAANRGSLVAKRENVGKIELTAGFGAAGARTPIRR